MKMNKRDRILYFLTLTREEKGVIIFLTVTLFAGSGILLYQKIRGPLIPSHYLESKPEKVQLININIATQRELVKLPGIGWSLANRIIELREKKGSFSKIEELLEVKGIGMKTLKKIKPYIYVGKENR